MTAVSAWVKLALDIAWAWISLSAMRSIYEPPGSYWVYVNRTMQVTYRLFNIPALLFTVGYFITALFIGAVCRRNAHPH